MLKFILLISNLIWRQICQKECTYEYIDHFITQMYCLQKFLQNIARDELYNFIFGFLLQIMQR